MKKIPFLLLDSNKRRKTGILHVRFDPQTGFVENFCGFRILPLFTYLGPMEDYVIMRLSPGHKTFSRKFYYVEWNDPHKKLIIKPIPFADTKRLTGINSYDF